MSARVSPALFFAVGFLLWSSLGVSQTTVQAEQSNNTNSTYSKFTDVYYDPHNTTKGDCPPADGHPTTTNGDARASNVSRVSARELLFDPAIMPSPPSTQLLVELQSWFQSSPSNINPDGTIKPCASITLDANGHVDIGYDSSNPTQIANQIGELKTRGYGGALFDWNGPDDGFSMTVAGNLRSASENAVGGFLFGIIIDKWAFINQGAISDTCASDASRQIKAHELDPVNNPISPLPACTDRAIKLINNYVSPVYVQSSKYIRMPDQRPIIAFFLDSGTPVLAAQVDWNQVRANVPGNPLLLGDTKSAVTDGLDGAYAWVNPEDSNSTLWSLSTFYGVADSNPSQYPIGGVFKGFDDTFASWSPSPPRQAPQRCGQLWLDTWAATRQYIAKHPALPFVQAVTWDDYEEGTELESGIDNCLQSLNAQITGNSLTWSPSFGTDRLDATAVGSEKTIHHYTVFAAASGGTQLTILQDSITGHQYDLTQAHLSPGNYDIYLKAVGQPNIVNHLAGPLRYAAGPNCSVQISSPINGQTTTSPVQVTGSATPLPGTSIASMEIDVDSTAVYSAPNVSSVNQSIPVASGNRTVAVKATDSANRICSAAVSITVQNRVTVNVSTPISGSTVHSPVTITASATSANPIAGWHIYVDSVDSFSQQNVSSISASVPMSAGTHTVIVRAWDNTGTFGDQTLTLTVAGVSVIVSSPSNNATVSSPVTINASATSANPITGWHIYVDDVDSFSQSNVSSISASLSMSRGTHTVIVRAWDNSGTFGDETLTLTVAETGPIVSVSSPANGATVSSPVTINASATSANPITGWHIYVDDVDSFSQNNVSSISASVPMSAGTHTVIVRAWDSTGAFGDQTLTFNVQ